MSKAVERYCRSCLACQAVTPEPVFQPSVKATLLPEKPWQDLTVDLLGPLPSGESLMVTVDYCSRWIEVDVLRDTSSSTIRDRLERHFMRHGIPKSVRTDNAANLVSKEMKQLFQEYGVEHRKTIPLWPRANEK
ncbi:Uncharacterised protein r2_g1756 [Pycnogonum litorale]